MEERRYVASEYTRESYQEKDGDEVAIDDCLQAAEVQL
jgi:hypothetical protein